MCSGLLVEFLKKQLQTYLSSTSASLPTSYNPLPSPPLQIHFNKAGKQTDSKGKSWGSNLSPKLLIPTSPAKPVRVSVPLGSLYPLLPQQTFLRPWALGTRQSSCPSSCQRGVFPPKDRGGAPSPGSCLPTAFPQTPTFYSQLDFNVQPLLSSVGKETFAKGGKAPLPLFSPWFKARVAREGLSVLFTQQPLPPTPQSWGSSA